MSQIGKILVIDDDVVVLKSLELFIKRLGFDCVSSTSSSKVLELISKECPDIVLTDLMMPGKDGIEVLREMKQIDPNSIVIILTGYGSIDSAVTALKGGAFDYIEKPYSVEQLEISLKKAIQCKQLDDESHVLYIQDEQSYSFDNIIGKTQVMQNLFKEIVKIAKSDGNVMISGESGTGKELIARSLHSNSNRCSNALIPVDCVALPGTLLESELFGYEKGAFTGAATMRRGLLEYAHNGTLFLDEICELPLNLQAKLLRVLQEGEFRRVGGQELIKVNLRIISATNKNPETAVQNQALREDLYYRLNVIPIELPPLRERKEDIEVLLKYFLKKYDRSGSAKGKSFHAGVFDALTNYHWPGNVRELQNLVERLVSLVEGDVIYVSDLPDHICNIENHISSVNNSPLSFSDRRKKILQNFEKEYFGNLLKTHKGNISKAAQVGQISRRTLYRMINTHDLHDLVRHRSES